MCSGLDQHYEKLKKEGNLIQLLFLETRYVEDRPIAPDFVLASIAKTHIQGLLHLSGSDEIVNLLMSFPMAPARFHSWHQYPPAPRLHEIYFIPWKVKLIPSVFDNEKIENRKLKSFLYCQSEKEYHLHINWFEEEEISDSFFYQLMSVSALMSEESIINNNSQRKALPVFKRAIIEWKKPENQHDDKISQSDESLYDLPFAPDPNQTVWISWAKLIETIKSNNCRHRSGLMSIFRGILEKIFFEGLNLDSDTQKKYLLQFQKKCGFSPTKSRAPKPTVQNPRECLDCFSAAKIIWKLVDEFLLDPQKKQYGEAACALWIMIWCSIEAPDLTNVTKILNLSSTELIESESVIILSDREVEISDGLMHLLSCLKGRGQAKRKQAIFPNINEKKLQRILEKISIDLFGTNNTVIKPSDFLCFPHIYSGMRMPHAQRKAMRRSRKMVQPLWTAESVLKDLRSSKSVS